MILNFIEKLRLDKHVPESTGYMKYAEKVYRHSKNEKGSELSELMHYPDYETFLNSLQSDISKNMNSLEIDPTININPHDFSNLSKTLLNLPKIIEFLKSFIQNNNNKEELILFFFHFIIFFEIHIKTVISIQNKKLTVEKTDIKEFIDRKIQFNQSEIAKEEYNVEKETFIKWIESLYGEYIYKKRRTIKFSEYIEMSIDLLFGKTENTNTESEYFLNEDNMEYYSSVISEGITYTRKKIVESGFLLESEEELSPREYSEARKMLQEEFSSYDGMKKLPVSVAIKMINALKEKS